jgi:hypothetical protein
MMTMKPTLRIVARDGVASAAELQADYDAALAQRPTPQATIEAILYCVRARGPAALKEPANIERLRRCDAAALAQIDARLAKLKGSHK